MYNLKDTLEDGEGYIVLEKFIPESLIIEYNQRLKELYPVRASSSKKVYAERDDIKNLEDISVWWSQSVHDLPQAVAIRRYIDTTIQNDYPNLDFYAGDNVTTVAGSQWINPHVDTPHRFSKWNYDQRLLGIQCIVSLMNTDSTNGSTGVVPYSHKRDFDIQKCYNGTYTRWFMKNAIQPNMPIGSVLLYNCRVLHSSMPNNTDIDRPALLFNYLDNSILDEVTSIDNIWKSNGK